MLAAALGMAASGAVITFVGVTRVFVPQDLTFMGITREVLDAVNPHLVPLLAHDRAGFEGAVFTTGLTAALCLWFGGPSRPACGRPLCCHGRPLSLSAVGIHVIVGYTDFLHLAPAAVGAAVFLTGLLLAYPSMSSRAVAEPAHQDVG